MNFPVIRFEGLFPEPSSQLEDGALTGLFGQRRLKTKHRAPDRQSGEWMEKHDIGDAHLLNFTKLLWGNGFIYKERL